MMTDLEVNLAPQLKDAFGMGADTPAAEPAAPNSIPPPPPLQGQISVESPKNVVSEWSPPEQLTTPPLIPRFRTLNSTFFVKPDEEDDGESQISSDTPTAIVFEAEQKIRDSIKAIQFKEMLLSRDKHSREVILRRCIEWLQLPTSRGNAKTLDWFMALSLIKTSDALENSYLWHSLHESLYASDSFKTVISLFDSLHVAAPLHK